jgi:ribonuclease T1
MWLLAHPNFFDAWQLRRSQQWLVRMLNRLLMCGLFALVEMACGSALAMTDVSLKSMPTQAQQTFQLIHVGGPFPYPKDGVIFGNRERQLPSHARGYYREYTVTTPGSRDRGARRIVCGGREPAAPDVCYYTQDHYASFRRIAP